MFLYAISFTFPLFSCSKRTIYSATYLTYVSLSRLCSAANFWATFCGSTNVEDFFIFGFLRSNFGAKYRFRSHIKHKKVNREDRPLLLKCLSTFWHITVHFSTFRRPKKAISTLWIINYLVLCFYIFSHIWEELFKVKFQAIFLEQC